MKIRRATSEEYWIERGRRYFSDFTKKTVIQRVKYWTQEQAIIVQLYMMKGEIEIRRILDAGCGFGRITKILCEEFPYSQIYGIDISKDQLTIARERMPRVQFRETSIINPAGGVPLNQLTVAVEVLMHIEPAGIEGAIETLTRGAEQFILTVDWWSLDTIDLWAAKEVGFCFLHDYEELFKDQGFELVREKKIPFVKQKIRVWRRRENE